MLGAGQRGVKRKLDDGGDDDEEGGALAGGGVGIGVGGVFSRDRDSVFTISLCKLNRYRQIPDPSLHRSVLICNTLRFIEREMESRGLQCSSLNATAGFLPAIQADNNIALDPLPMHTTNHFNAPSQLPVGGAQSAATQGTQQQQQPSPSPQQQQQQQQQQQEVSNQLQPIDLRSASYHQLTSYEKNLVGLDSYGRSTPFPSSSSHSDPCRTDSGALWSESDERCASSISWSTVLNLSNQSETTDFISTSSNSLSPSLSSSSSSSSTSGNSLTTLMGYTSPPNTSSDSSNSSSSSSSSGGSSPGGSEIFGDIDLSLYDFDLLPLSPPNMRLTPLSAEELLRSFPNNEPLPGVAGNVCFKNEFLSEDLDHIMHILVGM